MAGAQNDNLENQSQMSVDNGVIESNQPDRLSKFNLQRSSFELNGGGGAVVPQVVAAEPLTLLEKIKRRRYPILFSLCFLAVLVLVYIQSKEPSVQLNQGQGYIVEESSPNESKTSATGKTTTSKNSASTSTATTTSPSTSGSSATAEKKTAVAVSTRIVPKTPSANGVDGQLPSGKVVFRISPDLTLDENAYNEKDPNQKDFRSYKTIGQDSVLPIIYLDRWDKTATGASTSEAAQFGTDESSFKASLTKSGIKFLEENIIIDNKKATLIFVGKTATDMSFYCSVIQTVNDEFYTFTFTPQSKDTIDKEKVIFEEFLGSIDYK